MDTSPIAQIYAASVPFPKTGTWNVLSVSKQDDGAMVGAPAQVKVIAKSKDPIPDVGQVPPRVEHRHRRQRRREPGRDRHAPPVRP